MSKLLDRFYSWSEMKQNLFILLVVAIIGAAICVPFIFLDNIGVLLGWLLGSAVNILAYVSIAKGSSLILATGDSSKHGYWAMAWASIRLLLYAGSLLLAGFASFIWGSLAHGFCNIIAVALALMPTWITLLVGTMIRNAHAKAKPEQKPEDTPKEGE